jgi:hypothetical protein
MRVHCLRLMKQAASGVTSLAMVEFFLTYGMQVALVFVTPRQILPSKIVLQSTVLQERAIKPLGPAPASEPAL